NASLRPCTMACAILFLIVCCTHRPAPRGAASVIWSACDFTARAKPIKPPSPNSHKISTQPCAAGASSPQSLQAHELLRPAQTNRPAVSIARTKTALVPSAGAAGSKRQKERVGPADRLRVDRLELFEGLFRFGQRAGFHVLHDRHAHIT